MPVFEGLGSDRNGKTGQLSSMFGDKMITAAESYKIHETAWNDPNGDAVLADLARQIRETIESGQRDDALMINCAAVMLDLHQNKAALDWLLAHPVDYREYFLNLATAYAKLNASDLKNIRRNNEEATRYPSCPNAILAYIDYQAL